MAGGETATEAMLAEDPATDADLAALAEAPAQAQAAVVAAVVGTEGQRRARHQA